MTTIEDPGKYILDRVDELYAVGIKPESGDEHGPYGVANAYHLVVPEDVFEHFRVIGFPPLPGSVIVSLFSPYLRVRLYKEPNGLAWCPLTEDGAKLHLTFAERLEAFKAVRGGTPLVYIWLGLLQNRYSEAWLGRWYTDLVTMRTRWEWTDDRRYHSYGYSIPRDRDEARCWEVWRIQSRTVADYTAGIVIRRAYPELWAENVAELGYDPLTPSRGDPA